MEEQNNIVQFEAKQNYSEVAIKKIEKELNSFQGGMKEKAVSKFVASTLTHFCQESNRFAEAVYKTQRTLSDCCAEVMDGTGNQISDIDVYRGAVRHYFPNADVFFKMEILINGEDPTDEELTREPKKKTPAPKPTKKNKEVEEEEDEAEIEEIESEETEIEEIETAAPEEPKQESKPDKPKKEKAKTENKPKQENKPKELIQISILEFLAKEEI